MAEIALRDYVAEIESLIEGSSYDEAIAHCRHILGTYPKYLEVYRLLGKAALEKEDDRAAVDLFQRVLGADPEDFVARVGLSIVYDRQGALDDALWQMERGFELMPSNDVIQSELRRLYGRRDGVEPQRIALTRGALARMYAQGDLYDEAIAELRALLEDSPDRVDLQVLLAETLWRNEQRNEAAAVAERTLAKLPYCLSANLILGEIWLNGGFSEDGETLLHRAQAVDPDNSRANTLLGSASPLSEQTTTISRLEYQPRFAPAAEPAADEVPEWLAGLAGLALGQPEAAAPPGLPAPAAAPSTDVDLPDWLRSIDQAVSESTVEPAAAPVEETPDWMSTLWQQAQAPAEEAEPAMSAPESEAFPGWPSQPGSLATAESASTELTEPAAAAEGPALSHVLSEGEGAAEGPESETLPDWLSQVGVPEDIAEPSVETALPDWLSRIAEPPAEEIAEEAAGQPDWLSALGAAPPEPAAAEEPAADLAQADVPDWLQALRPQVSEPAVPAIELSEVEESEIPDWMAEFAGAPATEEALDFLQRLGEEVQLEPAETEAPLEAPPPMAVEAPAASVGAPVEAAPEMAAMPSAEDALAFLQSLAEGKEEELRAQAEREAEQRMETIVGDKPGAPPAQPAAPMPEVDELLSPDEALAFLQGLTAGKEEELRVEAERAAEERMEAIMGGMPGTSPLRSRAEPAEQPEPEPAAAPAPVVDELPSPDEALAFLQSLTAGKEDELREQAERAGEERMEAIMGGKPGTSPLRPQAEPAKQPEPEPAAEEAQPAPAEALQVGPSPVDAGMLAAEDALAFLQSMTAPAVEELAEPEMHTQVDSGAAEVGGEALAEPALEIGFWLQTADDEGAEPIAADYFERAAKPRPVVPTVPGTEKVTRAAATPVKPQPPTAPLPLPVGAEEFESRLAADPADHEASLGLARVWWASGDRDQSLQLYHRLIADEKFVSEVAADLQRNLETFEHADWYRALGDAQMKLGHLSHALNAYRQALAHL